MRSLRFWPVLTLLLLAALGLRIGFVVAYDFVPFHAYGPHCGQDGSGRYPGCERFLHHEIAVGIGGDALYYHDQAHLLVAGRAFIDPSAYYTTGKIAPSASHPPLYTVVVAGEDLLGLSTIDSQRIAGCLLGTLTVAVIALTARRMGGDRVGLLAGSVATLYPGLWIFNGTDMSETVSILTVAYLVHESYRYWASPSLRRAAWLGVVTALAAYSRSELILLAPLLLLPLALLAGRRKESPVRPMVATGVALGALVAALLPWVGFNMVRFTKPELLSTQFGITLEVSNCPAVYTGPFTGYWDLPACIKHPWVRGVGPVPKHVDESVLDAYWRHAAFAYMGAHPTRVLPVILAREGRVWWLYKPGQQGVLNAFVEVWDLGATEMFQWSFYALALAGLAGLVTIKRREHLPLFPILAPVAVVCLAVVVTYGTTRFQSSAEPSIVLAATFGVDQTAIAAAARVRALARRAWGRTTATEVT